MDSKFGNRTFLVLTTMVIVISVLVSVPSVGAQEGEDSPRSGIRPDAPPYGVRGPYAVGTMAFAAETPSHPTKVLVWYPALNPEGLDESMTYFYDYNPEWGDLPVFGQALQDAAPDVDNGPYPLVIYATGWNAQRISSIYLCEHLASHGFVVISIDYADNQGTIGQVPMYSTLFSRPQDISWQLDYAESLNAAGNSLEGMIDMERVAIVGYSHGGYTALVTAGAPLDLNWLRTWAAEHPEACVIYDGTDVCNGILDYETDLAQLAGLDAPPDGLWPSWADPRVDAIVTLSPGGGNVLGPASVSGVSVPVMMLAGSADAMAPAQTNTFPIYENLGSTNKSLVVFENANHMIFFYDCDAAPWLVPDFFWACADSVWDMQRAHDLADHFVAAFLLAELHGDEAAAAALAPDAVQFPGITYETTGF